MFSGGYLKEKKSLASRRSHECILKRNLLTPTPVLCFYLYSKSTHKKKISAQQRKKNTHVYQRFPPPYFFPSHHHFHLFTLFTPSCQRPVVWSHTNRIEQWWHGRRNGSFRDRDLKGRLLLCRMLNKACHQNTILRLSHTNLRRMNPR